ncbi:MAG TPA: MBL fold metallo-hydrolase [Vicinamibacterales bacterium]|nr:MBL fold metallo-hydrolase [Vicinamibacterales bacterium]
MRTRLPFLIVALLAVSVNAAAEDARAVIDEVSRAMGVTNLTSIALAGSAAVGNFGQSRTISFGLASSGISNFVRAIDFSKSSAHSVGIVTGKPVQGGLPAGPWEETIGPADGWAQQLEIWTTPWGFLKGAAANGATVKTQKIDGVPFRVITWSPPMKAPSGQPYRVVGYINAMNLVERTETWVEHPVFGDMDVLNLFSKYQDVGGLQVPARIAQRRMAMETFVAVITNVNINPANLSTLMASIDAARTATPHLTSVTSERIADGIYRLKSGYDALAVELKDYVVVLGGGSSCGMEDCAPAESEKLGLAIIAETKRLFPAKPIKYVVNTHPHFDHLAVLAPFAAEGITILTDDPNHFFIESALSEPRTLVGDALARSKKKPKVESVDEMLVLGDPSTGSGQAPSTGSGQAGRSIELHHLLKIEHSDGMLAAYLPKEKILFVGDIDVPAAGEPPSPSLLSLFQNVDRLNLDFDRYITVRPPVPDRPIHRADLVALAQDK